jgi:hypothetical protein
MHRRSTLVLPRRHARVVALDRQTTVDVLAFAVLLTLLATLLFLVAAPAHAASRTVRHTADARDTGRVVPGVVINEDGVRIRGEASRTSSSDDQSQSESDSDESGTLKFDKGYVSTHPVQIRDHNGSVRINGPVIQVDGDESDMVRVLSDAEVPRGERVDGDVVAVLGSVVVHGEVTGSAVAVLGSVTLDSTARVGQDAVAVGGAVNSPHGATVGGQIVSLGFLPIAWGLPALPLMLAVILGGWLSSLFLGWLLHVLFPDRMLRAAVTASRRTGLALVLGLVSAPLMIIACVLLLITVLGIPIALLLPVAYWLLTWAGLLIGSYVLGCKLMRRSVADPWGFAPMALGSLFVAALFALGAVLGSGVGFMRGGAVFFYLLGLLMMFGLTIIGIGAVLASRFGSQPADVFAHPRAHPGGATPGTPFASAPISSVSPVGSAPPVA